MCREGPLPHGRGSVKIAQAMSEDVTNKFMAMQAEAPARGLRGVAVYLIFIAVAALMMGIPTLRGTFIGGDDHRLVLNHVLVNHPSLTHALELFRIIHRDLYQPIPLLSFSFEFWIAEQFDLFADGVDAGAWLFHLTNVLLHVCNALLVFCVVNRLSVDRTSRRSALIAFVVAMGFAVHPLQVEVVAWINGRMMLLSTCFALATIVCLQRWLMSRRAWWVVATVCCALLCAISKIRVGLPLLLLIVPLVQRRKFDRPFIFLWAVITVMTGFFVWVNIGATSQAGMFEGARTHMLGSTTVRALLSLAWYFQHFVWPVGLASWYPAPGNVHWFEWRTLVAILTVIPAFVWVGISARRNRSAALAFGWFLVTIAATLQLVPTRNTLAADRYMYLPIIGLLWFVSLAVMSFYERMVSSAGKRAASVALYCGGGILFVALLAMSWHVSWFYELPLRKSQRLATLFEGFPHVHERLAWAYYNDEQYEKAIEAARYEFVHEQDSQLISDALQAIAASQFKLGQTDDAIDSLQRAMDLDPKSASVRYRLAMIYHEIGSTNLAIDYYEQAIEMAPLKNPWINQLGQIYRDERRHGDARRLYEQAVRNNAYEVPAILALAELDIAQATPTSYMAAVDRLETLLSWMPENTTARINLGVAYAALGKIKEAMHAYQFVLRVDPENALARLNLAQLLFDKVQSGEISIASKMLDTIPRRDDVPLLKATMALIDFHGVKYQRAASRVSTLTGNDPDTVDARKRLQQALVNWGMQHPELPWTLCVAGELWLADGQVDLARKFIDLCEQQCNTPDCQTFIAEFRRRLDTVD